MTNENIDTIKVAGANLGAILFSILDIKMSLSIMAEHIQTGLSIASLILAISYTAWKWRNDIIKKK